MTAFPSSGVTPPETGEAERIAPFRCGDCVLHRPSGEEWLVAFCEGDELAWAGWPDGRARASDCDLVKRATDDEHRKAVAAWFRFDRDPNGDSRRPAIARLYPDAVAADFENAGRAGTDAAEALATLPETGGQHDD